MEKALSRTAEIGELSNRRREIAENLPSFATEEKRKAIEDLVWMIEEYKVSLFAQELKTPFPVSRKKLGDKLKYVKSLF